MEIRITGRNFEVTNAIKAYIEKKLRKLRRYGDVMEIHLVLSLERHLAVVEAMLRTRNGTFHSSEKAEDLYEAVDMLLDNLRTRLKKHKEKIIDVHRISNRVEVQQDIQGGCLVSEVDRYKVGRMSIKEAVEVLEMNDMDALAFMNSSTGKLNVIYRSKDKYKLIEPEL